jgi:hypothetical protein
MKRCRGRRSCPKRYAIDSTFLRVLSQSSFFGAKSKNRVSEIQRLTDCQTLEKATLRQNQQCHSPLRPPLCRAGRPDWRRSLHVLVFRWRRAHTTPRVSGLARPPRPRAQLGASRGPGSWDGVGRRRRVPQKFDGLPYTFLSLATWHVDTNDSLWWGRLRGCHTVSSCISAAKTSSAAPVLAGRRVQCTRLGRRSPGATTAPEREDHVKAQASLGCEIVIRRAQIHDHPNGLKGKLATQPLTGVICAENRHAT